MKTDVKYDPQITPDFLYECAKVGRVALMSHQVVIYGKRELRMNELKIPDIYRIEYIGLDGDAVQITLKVKTPFYGA